MYIWLMKLYCKNKVINSRQETLFLSKLKNWSETNFPQSFIYFQRDLFFMNLEALYRIVQDEKRKKETTQMNHRRYSRWSIDDSFIARFNSQTERTNETTKQSKDVIDQAMASNENVTSSSDYDFVDLSEEDKIAAEKYLSENGVRGLEGFLSERLEVWRKWFVDLFSTDFISIVVFLV